MFILQKTVPVAPAVALTNDLGYAGQTAIDESDGDVYAKLSAAWTKVADGSGNPVAPPVAGAVTVRNSSGSITRALTAVAGVVTLAATDTIVANANTMVLQNSAGTVSAGNAGLNSPATALVSGGVLTAVKAGG